MSDNPEVKKLMALAEGLMQEAKKLEAEFKALAKKPIVVKIDGLNKAYMDAIKSSDGLTSVRPSTLKAIQAAEKAGTVETVKAAISGLHDQIGEVKKNAKDDAAKKKFAKFEKTMGGVAGKLEKIL